MKISSLDATERHATAATLLKILEAEENDRNIVRNALKFVKLNEVQKMYPATLSHFERRKVEFARALFRNL